MRDDIHKSAPVPHAWRQVIRYGARPADRDARAEEAARRAIQKDCQQELSQIFVSELLRRFGDSQGVLFGNKLEGVRSVADLGGAGNVLEHQVLASVQRLSQTTTGDQRLVTQAIAEVVQARCDSRVRAMAGHVLKETGRGVAECVQAVKGAVNSISAQAIAESIVNNNGRIDVARRASSRATIDENLLRKGK